MRIRKRIGIGKRRIGLNWYFYVFFSKTMVNKLDDLPTVLWLEEILHHFGWLKPHGKIG
jgi:hypothetical protein